MHLKRNGACAGVTGGRAGDAVAMDAVDAERAVVGVSLEARISSQDFEVPGDRNLNGLKNRI